MTTHDRTHDHTHAADSLGHEISRRRFMGACCTTGFAALGGTALANFLAACGEGSAAATKAQATLRVGHLPAGCVQHLLLASKRGLFAKEGLNVHLTQFNGPGDNLNALINGAQDVIHNPWTNTVAAVAKGQDDLRIIAGSGQGGIELVARKGSVENVDALAAAAGSGLRIGTLRLDTLELVTFGTLKKAGRSYDDYKMTFFPSMVGMGDALIAEKLDVCSLAQPYGATVVKKAGGTYLADSNDAWGPNAADCVITTTDANSAKHGSAIRTYLAVLQDAARQRDADPEKAFAELAPLYGVDKAILAAGLKRQIPQPVLDERGVQSLRNGTGFLADLGYLKDRELIDRVFDGSLQPKAA